MKMRQIMFLLLGIVGFAVLPVLAQTQTPTVPAGSPALTVNTAPTQPDTTYTSPTHAMKFHSYLFDAIGPYPIARSAFMAGIDQANDTPPEWEQGAEGYGKRLGSDFGIATLSTTARYALAEAFKEDTLYYPCKCKGMLPRLGHAVVSSFTARRGNDGHRVFSVPAIVGPYVGTTAAVYGWYPDRFGAKDALRMGNYSVLGSVGGNIATEFLFSGPHSLLSRLHIGNSRPAPAPGTGR